MEVKGWLIMEEIFKQLLSGQKQIIDRLERVEQEVSGVKREVLNVKGQLDENTVILRGLEHQSQVQKAQMDNLINSTARIEGEVKNLRNDVGTIEAVTAKNWNDIVQLKAVK